jgi:uncharacterized protein
MNPADVIAAELTVKPAQVNAAITLLDEGSTVPFIARYRKEVTGGLDDTQLRTLHSRLSYLRELQERRQTILASVEQQGKLTASLKQQLLSADTKTALEDLYLPYKQKRRTKAQIAREAGLQPLADHLLAHPLEDPAKAAANYVNAEQEIETPQQALEGAQQILMEQVAELPELSGTLREQFWQRAHLSSRVIKGKDEAGVKFKDYFDYSEALSKIPSHRALALLRGQKEGFLRLNTELPDLDSTAPHPFATQIARHLNVPREAGWLHETIAQCWRLKLHTRFESDLRTRLRENAETEAIAVFASNLRDLLLAAPAGQKTTIGLDPGLRTGVKVAVTSPTGKLLDTHTIYPHAPQKRYDEAIADIARLAKQHSAELVAIGNGTASRETDRMVADLIKRHPDLRLQKLIVSEAGASVYSASEIAAAEMPDIDVSLRGAVSIARRLQDPLAELVKVDAKAIGVGQYQHDVNQTQLADGLDNVVEDCVNAVGVDLNSASSQLLTHVSGLTPALAKNIVTYRDEAGVFKSRAELKKVPRLGPKAFEQCAGFLRISNGSNALDASAVHPEAYAVVKRISSNTGIDIRKLIGDTTALKEIDPAQYTDEQFGLPTVVDILSELEKPGRDPRPEFKTANFKEGVEKLSDLSEGMVLEGVVSNITAFGAFVDIGVHQDGLVHISAMADKFIKDPRDVVSTGDIVRVKVMEIDAARKRIALSMRLNDDPSKKDAGSRQTAPHSREDGTTQKKRNRARQPQKQSEPAVGALGDALLRAQKKQKSK